MTDAGSAIRRWREDPVSFVVDVFETQPDLWQHEALTYCGGNDFNAKRLLGMKACTGPGKAQPVDMLLDTPDGLRRWGDLSPGDRVFAADGSVTTVVAQTWRGSLPLFRVTFDDGTSTDCCAEHLWRIRGRTERRHIKQRSAPGWGSDQERRAVAQGHYRTPDDGWSTLSLAQMMARNDSNDGRTRRQFEIPQQGAVEYPEAETNCDPYVLGAWLGDGCRGGARGSWQDVGIDHEIESRGFKIGRSQNGKAVQVYGLAAGLRADGLLPLGSHERYVPGAYLRASIQQRKDVLAGLLDTDGTIGSDRSIAFDVTSERLANDVAWLVRSLGGKARAIRQKVGSYRGPSGDVVECRMVYRVTLATPFCPFKLDRKVARWQAPQDRYLTRWVESIEPIGPGEAMCIQVDHPFACYLANDFIVTHNSAVLAWIGWHRLLCFASKGEHPKGYALSVTADNLKDGLWAELAKWQGRSPLLMGAFKWTKERIYAYDHPETWFLSARSFAKDADSEAIGRALSGLHSQFPFILLDETGDMPAAVGRAAQQIFTGNPTDALIAQAGNPTSTTGLLYECCTRLAAMWHFITITSDPSDPKRTPRVDVAHAQEMIDTYGREDPWVMATILGLFPPAGFNQLLSIEDVNAAMDRHYRGHEFEFAARVLGVDVAREGDDKSIIFPRQGLVAFDPGKELVLRNANSVHGAGVVARKWDDWQADGCFVDNTGGFGGGWIDQLQILNKSPVGIHFAGKAMDPRYANIRAEMWWKMAEWVKAGGALPKIPELIAELTTPTYSFKGDQLLIEPKEKIKQRLGRSPDYADALALTFAYPVQARPRRLDQFGNMSLESVVADSYGSGNPGDPYNPLG